MQHSRLQRTSTRSTMISPHGSPERQLKPARKQLRQKLSPYRGVTFYRRTGRWEANLWHDKKQHYLGASFTALEAARAYDKAILFTRSDVGAEHLNFDARDYKEDMKKMSEMSFLQFRKELRTISKRANCQVVNRQYKGILIDQNGRWEVKYCLKNQQRPQYVLVGWYDNEENALSAYNETARKYEGNQAGLKSFHGRRDITRSRKDTRSRSDVPSQRIDMEVVSNLASGEESDHSTSTCNPGFQEQLQAELVGTRASVSREDIDGVSSELLAPGLVPVANAVEENEGPGLILQEPVELIVEPPSLCDAASRMEPGRSNGFTNEEGLSRSRNPQDMMQLSERRGEYHTDASDYWIRIFQQYQLYHGQNEGVVYSSHLIHNFFHGDSRAPHRAPSLNGGIVTSTATGVSSQL